MSHFNQWLLNVHLWGEWMKSWVSVCFVDMNMTMLRTLMPQAQGKGNTFSGWSPGAWQNLSLIHLWVCTKDWKVYMQNPAATASSSRASMTQPTPAFLYVHLLVSSFPSCPSQVSRTKPNKKIPPPPNNAHSSWSTQLVCVNCCTSICKTHFCSL